MKLLAQQLDGIKHIFRTCYFGDIHNTAGGCAADPTKLGLSKQLSCDVCTDNLCNGSTSIVAGAFLIVAAAFCRLFM
uniref:Protein sleepless n=1 Tax=Megaselia scalaris TaxID=36166 RepID=T1GNF8_MEGSC